MRSLDSYLLILKTYILQALAENSEEKSSIAWDQVSVPLVIFSFIVVGFFLLLRLRNLDSKKPNDKPSTPSPKISHPSPPFGQEAYLDTVVPKPNLQKWINSMVTPTRSRQEKNDPWVVICTPRDDSRDISFIYK